MKLAEMCGTDVSYIGQIEIGRRFPSIGMIEKIAAALRLEPYRLFMNEPGVIYGEPDETADFLAGIPQKVRENIITRLNTAISTSVAATLSP